MGHLVYTNVKYISFDKQRTALGAANGYQHLWKEAEGNAAGSVRVTWLNGGRYYSVVSAADTSTSVFVHSYWCWRSKFQSAGTSLRHVAAKRDFRMSLHLSSEPHGSFDPVTELAPGASGNVESINGAGFYRHGHHQIGGRTHYVVVYGFQWPCSETSKHTVIAHGLQYSWVGNYHLNKL